VSVSGPKYNIVNVTYIVNAPCWHISCLAHLYLLVVSSSTEDQLEQQSAEDESLNWEDFICYDKAFGDVSPSQKGKDCSSCIGNSLRTHPGLITLRG